MARKKITGDDAVKPLTIRLPAEGVGSEKFWLSELEDSENRLQDEIKGWQQNISDYAGARPDIRGLSPEETINVRAPYYTVEQKKPKLFFQTPDVHVAPREPGLESAAPIVKAVMNELLGPTEIDAAEMMDEVLNDCQIISAYGATKICYEATYDGVKAMPTGNMIPDPSGAIDPATGQPAQVPETTNVPNKVFWKYVWKRFSPNNLRIPAGFLSARYEDAPWLGMKFPATDDALTRDYGLDQNSVQPTQRRDTLANAYDRKYQRDAAWATEIWYKASFYDRTVKHPGIIRRLVILDTPKSRGPKIVIHENSPYHPILPDGRVGGMTGLPIHVFCHRAMPETAYGQSDVATIRDIAREKNVDRSLQIAHRYRNLPMRGVNKQSVVKDTVAQIEKGKVGSLILFEGPIQPTDIAPVPQAQFPPENFRIGQEITSDLLQTAGSGPNQQGQANQAADTATEASYIQQAVDDRLAKERARILNQFIKGYEKLFALVQLFADHPQIVEVVGEDGARQLETWDKTRIAGKFGFSAKPDSAVRLNAEEERQTSIRAYNLTANSPYVNQEQNARDLAIALGRDPKKFVTTPEPKGPEAPKVSISMALKDMLLVMNPEQIIQFMQAQGVQGLPQVPQPVATPDELVTEAGGVPPVSKHDADLSGQLSGPSVAGRRPM